MVPIVEWEGGGEKGKWFLEQAKGEGHLPYGDKEGRREALGGERGRKISALRDLFYISCPIVALYKCFSSIFLVDMALLWVKRWRASE